MSRRLEKSLRDSLSQLPRADLTAIIDADISKLEEHDYITRQELITKKSIIGRILITAAFSAVIIIGVFIWLLQNNSVNTMVTLDINAGFILTANSKGEVLKVKAIDSAALNVLRGVSYSGAGISDVTGALVSVSAQQHYLSDNNRYILISVWDKDQGNARKLLADITKEANAAAAAAQIDPEVLGQYLEINNSLEQDAEHLGITAGRLQLIEAVLKYKPSYTQKQLAGYNIENLLKIARAADISLPVSGYRAILVKPVIGQPAGYLTYN